MTHGITKSPFKMSFSPCLLLLWVMRCACCMGAEWNCIPPRFCLCVYIYIYIIKYNFFITLFSGSRKWMKVILLFFFVCFEVILLFISLLILDPFNHQLTRWSSACIVQSDCCYMSLHQLTRLQSQDYCCSKSFIDG